MSHYAKKALVGRRITTSFLNRFIFSCKYVDFIGQEPSYAKIRKRVCAKGIETTKYLSKSIATISML
jgi:hypothetical protein